MSVRTRQGVTRKTKKTILLINRFSSCKKGHVEYPHACACARVCDSVYHFECRFCGLVYPKSSIALSLGLFIVYMFSVEMTDPSHPLVSLARVI
jgi:hypothetical protein